MATFDGLTAEQKAQLQSMVNELLRPAMGELARVCNHLAALDTNYNALGSGILALLDDNDVVVTNESGLAGAASLTKGDIITMVAYAQGVLTNYNTTGHRQNFAKAAGAANLIG